MKMIESDNHTSLLYVIENIRLLKMLGSENHASLLCLNEFAPTISKHYIKMLML